MVVNMRSSRNGSASVGRHKKQTPTSSSGARGGGQPKAEEEELAVKGVRNPRTSRNANPWSSLHPATRAEESNISGWSVSYSVMTPPGLDRSVLGSPWVPASPAPPPSSRGGVTPQPASPHRVAGDKRTGEPSSAAGLRVGVSGEEEEGGEELGTLVIKSPRAAEESTAKDASKPGSPYCGGGDRRRSSSASASARPHSPAPKIRTLTPENVKAHVNSLAAGAGLGSSSSPRRVGGSQTGGGPPSTRSGRITSRSGGAEFGEGALLLEELEERMSELSDDFLDFMERMDRAAEGHLGDEGRRPMRGLPPAIASAILDVGLMELSPADILLQQFENHRAWHAAASAAAEHHKARSLAASMGGVDESGRWSPQRGRHAAMSGGVTKSTAASSLGGAGGSTRRRAPRVDPDVARRERLLELTSNFMERLRLKDGSELKKAVTAAKARVRDASLDGVVVVGEQQAGGEAGGWRGRANNNNNNNNNNKQGSPTRGRGEYVKFPELSFSGQPPIEELERGQFIKLPVTALAGVEAKFVRDKGAVYPLETADPPSQPLMLAPDGSGRASVNLYSRGRDQLWGEEIRGIAPAPNAPATEGAETEVLTYRGPGGAYMRRRVRHEPHVPSEQELLQRSLAKYDRLLAKKIQAERAEVEAEEEEMAKALNATKPQASSGDANKGGAGPSGEAVNPQLARQLNMHLGAMTSLFGGFDPSDEYC